MILEDTNAKSIISNIHIVFFVEYSCINTPVTFVIKHNGICALIIAFTGASAEKIAVHDTPRTSAIFSSVSIRGMD